MIRNFFFIFIFFTLVQTPIKANDTYFLDFKLILNESSAGKKSPKFFEK